MNKHEQVWGYGIGPYVLGEELGWNWGQGVPCDLATPVNRQNIRQTNATEDFTFPQRKNMRALTIQFWIIVKNTS